MEIKVFFPSTYFLLALRLFSKLNEKTGKAIQKEPKKKEAFLLSIFPLFTIKFQIVFHLLQAFQLVSFLIATSPTEHGKLRNRQAVLLNFKIKNLRVSILSFWH